MANPEHLVMLKQGVQAWNQWRQDRPGVLPDLSGADLIKADLNGANLSKANLAKTYLRRVYLNGANLSQADLSGANLGGSDLIEANLIEANLSGADLFKADLNGANLFKANLSGANLSGANLSGANLSKANLLKINLRRANLRGANLMGGDLRAADLCEADLNGVNLIKADLRESTLSAARLINANLDEANLTDACLWEIQVSGWSIKDVICESVYWDMKGASKTVYGLGKFENLYTEKTAAVSDLTRFEPPRTERYKIRINYPGGIRREELTTLNALIQNLQASHNECKLRFHSIEAVSNDTIAVIVVDRAADVFPQQMEQLKAAIQAEAEQKARQLRRALEDDNPLLKGEIRVLERQVYTFLSAPAYYLEKGSPRGGTYKQSSTPGENASAFDLAADRLETRSELSVDLGALAQELSALRQAVARRQDPSLQTAITLGEIAMAESAAREKNVYQVVSHLKAAGQWALDFTSKIEAPLVVEAIKQALREKI